jgi:acetoin utilization protein AcuB
LVNVFEVMTTTIVAAHESTTAMEASTKLLIGNFNGLPVIDSNDKLIGIVIAVDSYKVKIFIVINIMTRNPIVVK